MGEFYKTFKMNSYQSFNSKIEEEETLPSSFYEATFALNPNPSESGIERRAFTSDSWLEIKIGTWFIPFKWVKKNTYSIFSVSKI